MPPVKKPAPGITQHPTMTTAVCAAQLQMANAIKDAKNPHFKSNYATLAVVRDIVIPAYAANGVAFVQEVIGIDGQAGIRSTLYWQGDPAKPRETMPAGDLMTSIGTGRNASQDCGAAATYYRRYMYAAVGGIAQADDDAQSLTRQPPQRQSNQAQPRVSTAPVVAMPNANCPHCNGPVKDNRAYAVGRPNEPYFFCLGNSDCSGHNGNVPWGEFNNPNLFDDAPKPATTTADGEIPF